MRKKCARCEALATICRDLHWMARRYADGRSSYAPSLFNEHVHTMLRLGVPLNPTADGTIWAYDGMGRDFDHLTDNQATPGTDEALGVAVLPEGRVFLADQLAELLGTREIAQAVKRVEELLAKERGE